MTENDIVDLFIKKELIKNEITDFKKEIPFEGTRIDLSFLDKKGILNLIEFKKNDFNKVLYQAKRIKILGNATWICVIKNKKEILMRHKCILYGIGLIFFDSKKQKFIISVSPKLEEIKVENLIKNKLLNEPKCLICNRWIQKGKEYCNNCFKNL